MSVHGKRRMIGALVASLLVLSACGGSEGTPADDGEVARGKDDDDDRKGRAKGKDGAKAKGDGRGKGAVPVPDPTTNPAGVKDASEIPDDVGPDTDADNDGVPDGPDQDTQLATASAVVQEPRPDAETKGVVPAYAEVLVAAIEGLGENFRVTMTFNGEIPDRIATPDTYMVIGVGLDAGGDRSYAFGAQGSKDGWKVYAGGKQGATGYPGTFAIRGTQVIMTLPWSYVGGPHEFDWYANSSWFQTIGGATNYVFDPIPNEGPARFPN